MLIKRSSWFGKFWMIPSHPQTGNHLFYFEVMIKAKRISIIALSKHVSNSETMQLCHLYNFKKVTSFSSGLFFTPQKPENEIILQKIQASYQVSDNIEIIELWYWSRKMVKKKKQNIEIWLRFSKKIYTDIYECLRYRYGYFNGYSIPWSPPTWFSFITSSLQLFHSQFAGNLSHNQQLIKEKKTTIKQATSLVHCLVMENKRKEKKKEVEILSKKHCST